MVARQLSETAKCCSEPCVATTGCRPHPSYSSRGKACWNHLNEEITPLLPTGAGERYSQTPRAPEWMSPRRNWDSPNPPPASECALPPPQTKGLGGHTRLRLKGWRSHNSDDCRKSLALCLLCEPNHIKFRTCSALAPMWTTRINESAELTQGAL